MCTNKRVIKNKYTGRSVLVSCGHCPACLQSRADRMARLISTSASKKDTVSFFITLTYKNECLPYVTVEDLKTSHSSFTLQELPVRRDTTLKSKTGELVSSPGKIINKLTFIPTGLYHEQYFKTYIASKTNNKIGVINYKDLQGFFKRLRSRLTYNKISADIAAFSCAEYGPTTFRPHFHLFLRTSAKYATAVRTAALQSWPYDNSDRSEKSIEIARNVGQYVASYVNCASSIPEFLRTIAPPRHSSTQHFGFDDDKYSISYIENCINKKSFVLPINFTVLGGVNSLRLLPQSVVCRYFPQFKGLSRLSPLEIRDVLAQPTRIAEHAERLELSGNDIRTIVRSLNRGRMRTGYAPEFYAEQYDLVWKIYKQNILKNWYQQREQQLIPENEAFDIVAIHSRKLSMEYAKFLVPPNLQEENVNSTIMKRNMYYKKIKQKKVTNNLMAALGHNV